MKTLNDLLAALTKADQTKEASFRVETWKMVIASIVELQSTIQQTNNELKQKPNVEDIKASIKSELKSDLDTEDAGKLLF